MRLSSVVLTDLTVARVELPCLERSVGSVERTYVLVLHFLRFLPASRNILRPLSCS